MATFKKGNKKASKHGFGPKIVTLNGRSGYYIRWYIPREKKCGFTVTAFSPHNLSLRPAKKGGLQITSKPKEGSLLANCIDVGDIILKVAGFYVNTIEEFNAQIKAFDGQQILIHINKGGKTGTVRRLIKAGNNIPQAEKTLRNLDNIIKQKNEKKSKINVLFSQIVNDFIEWAETPEASYAKSWLKDIKRIMKAHNERWGTMPVEKVTPTEIQSWINKRSKEIAASTLNNELAPLRKAFKLAVRLNKVKEDPTCTFSFRKSAESVHKALSEEEVNILLEIAHAADNFRLNPVIPPKGGIRKTVLGQKADELRKNRYNKNGTFDTARIRFLLLTALRKGQFIDLKWEQYDQKRGTITLHTTKEHSEKGRMANVIPLPQKAKAIIDGQPHNSEYIFPNLCGGNDLSIANRLTRGIFKAYEKQTGKHIHLHMLRHTAITNLLRHTNNIVLVKDFAGHRKIETTLIYAKILLDDMSKSVADFDI